jgi:hypothetical protein
LHVYVAEFFHHEGLEEVCSRQFDETALLAMGESSVIRLTVGVLVEELVSECLGENGHKIFIEDEDEDEYEESGLDGAIINDNRGTQERAEDLEEESQEEIAGSPSEFEKPEFDDDLGSQSDFH